MRQGFGALERMLADSVQTGSFCHGESPSLADCCLVPQIANARRLQWSLDDYPTMMRVHDNCVRLSAFARAAPSAQLDAE
jgi:glutathione S-transferase